MSTFVSFNHQVMPIETCEFQFKKKKTQKNQLPAQLTIVKGRQLFGQLPIEKEKRKFNFLLDDEEISIFLRVRSI
jgi:hypothetical protein